MGRSWRERDREEVVIENERVTAYRERAQALVQANAITPGQFCLGKVRYASRRDVPAQMVGPNRARGVRRMAPYHCAFCDGYHLTTLRLKEMR